MTRGTLYTKRHMCMLSPTAVAVLLFLAMHAATDCFPLCETSLVCITFVHVDDYSLLHSGIALIKGISPLPLPRLMISAKRICAYVCMYLTWCIGRV